MTDAFYSFDDTDALLASLSSSSANTSPSDNGEFSSGSGKASSYGLSPEEEFLNDNYWDSTNSDSKTLNEDFYSKDLIDFNAGAVNNVKLETQPQIKNIIQDSAFSESSIPDINTDLKANQQISPAMLKRETSEEDEFDSSPEAFSIPLSKKQLGSHDNNKITKPKKSKATHNVIEKKYRTNINSKITALRDSVPSLRLASGDANTTLNDLDGLSPAAKVNKAIVLEKATEYIQHLERKNLMLMRENQQMKHYLGSIPAQQQQQFYSQQQFNQQQQQQPQQPSNQFQTDSQFQPANYNGQQVNIANAQQPYQMGLPGRVLMGGMATMVGQQLFNGNDYDYRGLSAFPMLGNPLFIKFLHIVQFFFVASSIVYLVHPSLFQKSQPSFGKNEKSKVALVEWYELIKELVFIKIGSKSKRSTSASEIDTLVNQTLLLPDRRISLVSLIHLLLRLQTFETIFEVSFAKLVVAKLIITYSDFSAFFNLNALVETCISEIANQKVSNSNLRHFFKELKSPHASDTEAFKRLLNLAVGLPIGANCKRGIEDKGFILVLRDERVAFDYKTLLVSFRANEVFREVLLEYINLTFNQEEISKLDNDELREGKKELWNKLNSAENLAPNRSIVDIRIKLFKSILNEKYVDSVLKLVNEESKALTLTQKLNGQVVDSQESSKDPSPETTVESSSEETAQDEEIYDSDEFFEESDIEEAQPEPITPPVNGKQFSIKPTQQSSVSVSSKFQTLLSQDLFNALVSSSILKYIHSEQQREVSKLLKYIKFNKDELTLLSFISLYKLIQKFPKQWIQGKDGEIVENLVAHLRVWIGDSKNLNFNDLKEVGLHLKREISDNLVETGKSFSELD